MPRSRWPAASSKLSKRQTQLIAMLDQGMSNRDIATELDISEHTVKVHLWRLFRRLGVKSRTQALHHARTNGLLVSSNRLSQPVRNEEPAAGGVRGFLVGLSPTAPEMRVCACDSSASCSATRNTLPRPRRERTLTGWPSACDSRATIARPRPKPSEVPAWSATL